MMEYVDIVCIALFTGWACAIIGNFLVVRGLALVSDAISHSALLGIVIGVLIWHDLNSPYVVVAATLMGVATVYMIEWLIQTRLMASDAATAVIFPCLFSIAIILITNYASHMGIDTNKVLFGDLAFAPFNRFYWGDIDLGAKALYMSAISCVVVSVVVYVFYKELCLASFDAEFSQSIHISPAIVHYGIMTVTSFTAVTSFQVIGAMLLIAFLIIPAVTASFVTRTMKARIAVSLLCIVIAIAIAMPVAIIYHLSLAGTMGASLFFCFLVVAFYRLVICKD